eukprot:5848683-Alexandrium_andersonii.AAC.1
MRVRVLQPPSGIRSAIIEYTDSVRNDRARRRGLRSVLGLHMDAMLVLSSGAACTQGGTPRMMMP